MDSCGFNTSKSGKGDCPDDAFETGGRILNCSKASVGLPAREINLLLLGIVFWAGFWGGFWGGFSIVREDLIDRSWGNFSTVVVDDRGGCIERSSPVRGKPVGTFDDETIGCGPGDSSCAMIGCGGFVTPRSTPVLGGGDAAEAVGCEGFGSCCFRCRGPPARFLAIAANFTFSLPRCFSWLPVVSGSCCLSQDDSLHVVSGSCCLETLQDDALHVV